MERQSEHSCASHDGSVLRSQDVYPRHRSGFGRVGQTPDTAGLDREAQQVAQELRVASRPLRDVFQNVPRQRIIRGRELRQPERVACGKRFQLQSNYCGISGALKRPASRRATRKKPVPPAEPPAQVSQELCRGSVHVLRVLDLDQRRIGHRDLKEPADDFMQLRSAVVFGQHLDLGGRRNLEAEYDGDQWQPRRQVRGHCRYRLAQPLLDDGIGIVPSEIHELPQ